MVLMRFLIPLLAACSQDPTVLIHFVAPEKWSDEDRYYVLKVSESWEELDLDFEFTDSPKRSATPCLTGWYKVDQRDCTIDIGLFKTEGLIIDHRIRGYADRVYDEAHVDASLTSHELLHVTAHEIGHVLLNTGRHLQFTQYGIMRSGGDATKASLYDLNLACEVIERGCQ